MAQQNQVQTYTGANGTINIVTLASTMQSGVTNQQNVPLLAFGALIFYSANIIVNLMLNFFTAIPQMITILFSALVFLVPGLAQSMGSGSGGLGFIALFQAIVTIIYMLAVLVFLDRKSVV